MDYEETTRTSAELAHAWTALSQVTSFPRWTASMESVTPLDGEELAVGRRYRIRQPGLPPTVWRVSEVRAGEAFTWEASSPGAHTTAYHRLIRNPDGSTQITIGLHQRGALAGLLGLVIGRKTRRFLTLEAAGLKAAAEAAGADPARG